MPKEHRPFAGHFACEPVRLHIQQKSAHLSCEVVITNRFLLFADTERTTSSHVLILGSLVMCPMLGLVTPTPALLMLIKLWSSQRGYPPGGSMVSTRLSSLSTNEPADLDQKSHGLVALSEFLMAQQLASWLLG